VLDVLEAAHIYPYRGDSTNHVANGLLLRADLHTLLDCGLPAIDPDGLRVAMAPSITIALGATCERRSDIWVPRFGGLTSHAL
jgi:HNH endonuclease